MKFYILTIYILTITFSDNTSINFNVYCNYEICEPVIHSFAFIPQNVGHVYKGNQKLGFGFVQGKK